MAQLQEITTESALLELLSTTPPTTLTVLYFHTPWAPPCKQMHTILTSLASTYSPNTPACPVFLSLDAETLPDVSERYSVTAVPFLVLLRSDTVLDTLSGSDASKVRTLIERHAGSSASIQPTARQSLPPIQAVNPSKDLSGYVPTTDDPQTAPEMTSNPAVNVEMAKTELHARLGKLVIAAPVMLFMKGAPSAPQCGFSRQLVALLRERGVRYGFFNILADDEVRQGLKDFADWPTFPQLWAGGELVGGLDIVSLICRVLAHAHVRTYHGDCLLTSGCLIR